MNYSTGYYNNRPWSSYDHITTIELPYGLINIGNYAFSSCWQLERVNIPSTVTVIGENAFDGCGSLTEITIPDSVIEIGPFAFHSCSSLESVTIPGSVTSIGDMAFRYCYDLTSVTLLNGVLSIGEEAFYECTSLESVVIPNSVTEICQEAFELCSALTSISIPNSVTSIGNEAFRSCTSLNTFVFPASVIEIGWNQFYDCPALSAIIVDEENSVYCSEAGCLYTKDKTMICQYPPGSGRNSFTIPNGVTAIRGYAFATSSNLNKIVIPDTVTDIGAYAFQNCCNLTEASIPNHVEEIGWGAFLGCTRLTNVTIPNSVTYIEDDAFMNCSSITSITIPDSVIYVGSRAFSGCTSLVVAKIGNGIKYLDSQLFKDCTSLTNVVIPDYITKIPNSTFQGCSSLEHFTVSSNVTEITYDAFCDCSALISIVLPNSLERIYDHVFYGCDSLQDVYYIGTESEWNDISIGKDNDPLLNATIHFLPETETHTLVKTDAVPATCEEDGNSEYYTCTDPDCGKFFSDAEGMFEIEEDSWVIPAGHGLTLGFDFDELPATCKAPGYSIRTCLDCGQVVDSEHYSKNPNNHVGGTEIQNAIEADCTTAGYTGDTVCLGCGATISTGTSIPAAHGKKNGFDVDSVAATCKNPGYSIKTCLDCGQTVSSTSYPKNPNNHVGGTMIKDAVEPDCTTEGYTGDSYCKGCGIKLADGESIPANGHTWGEWTVQQEATYLHEGIRVRLCEVCSAEETDVIPTLLPDQTIKDDDSGAELGFQDGVLPVDTEIVVDEEYDGTSFRLLNLERENNLKQLFNITLESGGEKIQPNGYVLVKLPIPDGFNPENLKVYYISGDENIFELIDSYVEDGYICFETTHFSDYAVVDESSQPQPDPNACPQCGKVHTGFFGKIVGFFHKIIYRLTHLFKK